MFRKHQVASAAIMPVSKVAEPAFRENVLDKMSNDKMSLIARNDSEICLYGQRMYKKYGKHRHQHQYIRQEMRQLARFLNSARAVDSSVLTLQDCIDSTKFSVCVEAVKNLCGYDSKEMTFTTPSLAKKIGHACQSCETDEDQIMKTW